MVLYANLGKVIVTIFALEKHLIAMCAVARHFTCLLLLSIALVLPQSSKAVNYYWVGGTGNWTELSHWATSSGGTIAHNQIPTAADDVFFDNNAFNAAGQSVTINTLTAICKSINWTGVTNNPSFICPLANNMRVYGSFVCASGMTLDFNGALNFESTTTGNNIGLAGHELNGQVNFNGSNGAWSLIDSFSTYYQLNLNSGTFNTNGFLLKANSFYATGTQTCTLNMGASEFRLSGSGSGWLVTNSNLTLNSGTSVINMSGTVIPLFSGGGKNYYNLNFTSTNPTTEGGISGNSSFNNVVFYCDGSTTSASFNSLTFLKNARINDNITCQNLTLTGGYNYSFLSGFTTTITGSFNAIGNCGAYVSMASSSNGTQATISKASGVVNSAFLILKDMKAIGGATFNANNSIDLGNNTGWTIAASSTSNLYWVGNAGNWSDGNHWSLTSGGSPSGCSPTPFTNVFFDANSFSLGSQTVSLDNATAYCRNMSWVGVTNNPTIAGSFNNNLSVHGSLTFAPNMVVSYNGKTFFSSTTANNTITSAGKTFIGAVSFEGIGGGYSLLDSLDIATDLIINAGNVNSNSHKIKAKNFRSLSSLPNSLTLGSSVMELSASSTSWQSNSAFTLNAGNSTINFLNASNPTLLAEGSIFNDVNFTSTSQTANAFIQGNNVFRNVVFKGQGGVILNNTFSNLTFEGNGRFDHSNTIVNLILTPGQAYSLKGGTTQTITGNLVAQGNCTGLISIYASQPGVRATIQKTSGAINTNYLILNDIAAIGGAVFNATNSVDLGNNSGWNISNANSNNFYWIGNSGDWGDVNHWSFTSGGSPAGCLPSPVDNVFFDANSFASNNQVVTINTPFAYCRNMNWTGATGTPKLAGAASSRLKLFGSLVFIPNMELDFNGNVAFNATTLANTITSAAKVFRGSVFFSGLGGSWILQDSLKSSSSILLEAGTLNSNNQKVIANSFTSNGTITRQLIMGNSTFELSSVVSFWDVTNTGFNILAGSSTIVSTGNLIPFFYGGGLRYYDLKFQGNQTSLYGTINGNNTFHNVEFNMKADIQSGNTFNELRLLQDATLRSDNTIGTLILTPGNTYKFASTKTQTILNRLQAQGTCTSYLIMESTTPGTQANISKANGNVLGYNIHMKDLRGLGGANFFAYSSLNLGNNTGWNFTVLPNLLPPAVVTGPTSVCSGATNVVYSTTTVSGAIYYQWTVPAGATIVSGQGDTSIIVNFGTASTGAVSVLTYNGCNFSVTGSAITVVVSPTLPPAATIAPNITSPVCVGTAIIVTATATNVGNNPVTYNFFLNGIQQQSSNSNTFNFVCNNNTDVITCTIITTGSSACSNSNTANSNPFTPQINNTLATPTVSLSANPATPSCVGDSIVFTATANYAGGGSISYHFFVNGVSAQNSNSNLFSSRSLTNGQTVNCVVTITGDNCLTTNTATSNNITVQTTSPVTPSITISTTGNVFCQNVVAAFSAIVSNQGGSPVYQWKINGNNVGSNAAQFSTNSLNNNDVVTCTLTSNAGCVTNASANSNSIVVTIIAAPTPSVSIVASNSSVCQGSPINFTASTTNISNGFNYQWKSNGLNVGNNSASWQPNSLSNGAIVTCSILPTAGCFSGTVFTSNAINIVIYPLPVVSLTPNITILHGNNVQFNPISNGSFVSYAWTPGLYLDNANIARPVATPDESIRYTLTVVDNNGCQDTAVTNIKVLKGIFIPTGFSPNNDGLNDVFRIPPSAAISSLENFSIYNRFGEKVFETNNLSKGWDGTYQGQKLPPGVYVYTINAKDAKGVLFLKGSVTLIR
jgi:gliding motility-associated-like protein